MNRRKHPPSGKHGAHLSEQQAQYTRSAPGLLGSMFRPVGKEPLYFIRVAFVAFIVYSFLYGVWKLPFLDFGIARMSGVTIFDYLFLLGVSLAVALLFTLGKREKALNLRHDSRTLSAGSGTLAGVISAACPVCQGITIAAFGSTLFNVPLGILVPYLGFIKVGSLALLGLAVFFKADALRTRTCPTILPRRVRLTKKRTSQEPLLFRNNYVFGLMMFFTLLIVFNQFIIPRAYALQSLGLGGSVNIGKFSYDAKTTLKPMPLAQNEEPAIKGYRSKVKSLPTISELQMQPSTGDAVQDLMNNIIPHGTPWYGEETGVSFDDPIKAQQLWGRAESLQLGSTQEERWKRIVNSFTCDYCCGSPQRPTIITQCGCAHAAAARGMAKWFIKNHGEKYSDEEIYGEMARWYALWYPKGTIERIIQESQA